MHLHVMQRKLLMTESCKFHGEGMKYYEITEKETKHLANTQHFCKNICTLCTRFALSQQKARSVDGLARPGSLGFTISIAIGLNPRALVNKIGPPLVDGVQHIQMSLGVAQMLWGKTLGRNMVCTFDCPYLPDVYYTCPKSEGLFMF